MMGPVRALVEGSPQIEASTPAQTAISDSAAQVLATNHKRKGLIIQNTGTTIIKLVLGTGTPTATVFHVALKACSAANDGTGGAYIDDSWIGPVQAISSAVGGTMVITEISTGSPDWNRASYGGSFGLS
jgi:hypothetical protein